ncbi:MAG: aminomethyltransferase beta-barrel domain-containing protein [Butyricicoccaceae bacterium]
MVYPQPDGSVRIVFERAQRAISPGQAAVLYGGDQVLGGGTILRAERLVREETR